MLEQEFSRLKNVILLLTTKLVSSGTVDQTFFDQVTGYLKGNEDAFGVEGASTEIEALEKAGLWKSTRPQPLV